MKRIILIGGKALNGKSTTAKMMKETLESKGNTCAIAFYASHIKKMLREYYGWDGIKNDWARNKLQYLGTERIRVELNMPDFHVAKTCEEISIVQDDFDYIIIDDLRFVNEIEYVKKMFLGYDVLVFKVVREDFATTLTEEQQNHPSEIALDGYRDWDLVIKTKNLEELKEEVERICELI